MDSRLAVAREEAASRLNEALVAVDVSEKLERLRHVLEIVLHREPRLFQDFLPAFLELQVERAAPIRRWLAELAEEAADKLPQYIPSLAPALLTLLSDGTAAVAKRALQSGHAIFRTVFLHVAAMGTVPCPPDKSLVDAWSAMHSFKSAAYKLALQPCNDGVRMHAIEFMKTTILLFTPVAMAEVSRSSAANGAAVKEFDIARIAPEHRVLDVRNLAQEANENLSSLLSLLQPQSLATLPPSVALVLLQSLPGVAKQRLPYYGQVVPVFLALAEDQVGSAEPMTVSIRKALRVGLTILLRCTSLPETAQWQEKLAGALKLMGGKEDAVALAIRHAAKASRDPRMAHKVEGGIVHGNPGIRKRSIKVESVEGNATTEPAAKRPRPNSVLDAKAFIMAANGDREALSRLADELGPEILADVVISFMQNLPASLPALPLQSTLPVPPPAAAASTVPSTSTASPSSASTAAPALLPLPAPEQTVSKRDPRRDPRLAAKRTAAEAGISSGGATSVGTGAAVGAEAEGKGRVVRIKVEPGLEKTTTMPAPLPTATVVSSGTQNVPAKAAAISVPLPPLPVVVLSEEVNTAMRRSAFKRILESQQAIATTGASDLRLALLARLSTQVDEGAINILQQHILFDYVNNKGHELSLQLLYHLAAAPRCSIAGAEECTDNQKNEEEGEGTLYDKVLTLLADGLGKTLPFNNQSLQRLLCEAPLLTEAVFNILRRMCGLAKIEPVDVAETDDTEKEKPINADTVTQGLTILWRLILNRPPFSSKCLGIALECTLHEVDEYRDKACRLVANRLYGNESWVAAIEEFASNSLERVANKEVLMQRSTLKHKNDSGTDGQPPNPAVENAKRFGALFFALCSKKQGLLPQVFEVFGRAPKAGKAGIVFHVKNLARSAGPTPEFLSTISNQPLASHPLVLQVLYVLSESAAPSQQVIDTVHRLYDDKKDAQILIPILSSLSKTEVLGVLPKLVDLEPAQFRSALSRILQGSVHAGPALSPTEVLVAIHGIETNKDKDGAVRVKKVLEACVQCMNQKAVFTAQVLKNVLSQLIEQTPLPVLFMRTVIDALHSFPSLMVFGMELLSRLITKQVWKMPMLWTGFLKCVEKYSPNSLSVLVQLPTQQLEDALGKYPLLKDPLINFISQPHTRSTIPRSSLELLDQLRDAGVADSAAPPQSTATP